MRTRCLSWIGLIVGITSLVIIASLPASALDEEFVGPFPSWRDLRRDFGARGDGQADDTVPLQRALDELTKHTNACVLYVPPGVYRITETVQTTRKSHTDCQGVTLVGGDPAQTILRWDGTNGGTMFQWDAWYSKISRLGFDGAGKARLGLYHGPAFSTYNETSDLIFRDLAIGIQFGRQGSHGQAENAVLRCQFLRCSDTGILTVNWNTMDIWIWHSRFEDCGKGVYNVMGNFHVWECLFLRSRVTDIGTLNLMVFSVVNNTSIGSRRFFDFGTGHTWGSPVTLSGNRVIDPTGDLPVVLDNAGPYLVMDNTFRFSGPPVLQAVKMTWGDQAFVGNTYTHSNAVLERGRFRRLDEKVVAATEISTSPPALPSTPAPAVRKIIEVPANTDDNAIQHALDEAAKLNGHRPVVHLPMGTYRIRQTLAVPRNCDLQIVGDGAGETATRLNWEGPRGGVMLKLEGPSQVTLRDLYMHAPNNGRAILVEDADQAGGRVFADQLNVSGPHGKPTERTTALRIRGLDETDVLLRCLQGSGNSGGWVEVIGGPAHARGQAGNQVSIVNGATSSAAGQYDVRQNGQLAVRGVYHERSADSLRGIYLTDSGTLAIDATRFSYATSASAPTVAAHNFKGLFTIASSILMPVDSTNTCRFELTGDGSAASVLCLNNQFWVQEPGVTAEKIWLNRAQPPARGGLVGCNMNSPKKNVLSTGFGFLDNLSDHPDIARSKQGAGPLDNRGGVDDATLRRHLAPLRETRLWLPGEAAKNVTDLRIYRVMASGGSGATVEFQAGPATAPR